MQSCGPPGIEFETNGVSYNSNLVSAVLCAVFYIKLVHSSKNVSTQEKCFSCILTFTV